MMCNHENENFIAELLFTFDKIQYREQVNVRVCMWTVSIGLNTYKLPNLARMSMVCYL